MIKDELGRGPESRTPDSARRGSSCRRFRRPCRPGPRTRASRRRRSSNAERSQRPARAAMLRDGCICCLRWVGSITDATLLSWGTPNIRETPATAPLVRCRGVCGLRRRLRACGHRRPWSVETESWERSTRLYVPWGADAAAPWWWSAPPGIGKSPSLPPSPRDPDGPSAARGCSPSAGRGHSVIDASGSSIASRDGRSSWANGPLGEVNVTCSELHRGCAETSSPLLRPYIHRSAAPSDGPAPRGEPGWRR